MYKLVAIDLDGTLLTEDKQVTARTKAAIKAAREKGVQVVLASGRPHAGMMHVLEEVGINTIEDYVICFNGANILNVKTHENVYKNTITGEDLHEVNELAMKRGLHFHAFGQDGLFTEKMNKYTDHEAEINKIDIQQRAMNTVLPDEDIIKVMIVDSEENLDKLEKELPGSFHDKYSVVRSYKWFVEFLNPKANKGVAITELASQLGISMDEVMAFGDAGNDFEMVKAAGMGIAMGNAFDYVKDIAQYVTDTNNNDGVAKAIEKFILEEK